MSVNILGTPELSTNRSSSIDVVLPAGIQVGELLGIALCRANNATINTPPGWMLEEQGDYSYHSKFRFFTRVADGTEGASVTITFSNSDNNAAVAFRTDSTGVGAKAKDYGNNTSLDCPAITTGAPGSSVLRILAADTDATDVNAVTLPAGTVIGEEISERPSTNAYIGVVKTDHPTAGDSGTATFGITPTSRMNTISIELLAPAPSGPTIDDVDGDEIVTDGQSGATVSLSGFTGTPTLKLKHGAFVSPALSYTGDETGGTFDMPDYAATVVDVVGAPIGQSGTKLLVENGAETAEIDITINPKAGWSITVAASAGTGLGYLTNDPVADGSVGYIPDTNNQLLHTDFVYETDSMPFTGVLWNSDTGIWEQVTVNEAGPPDTTAPTITLIGSYSPVILLGSAWVEPGYTATDDVDGDITASVVVGGDVVDTNTLGMYAITYNVPDAAGNNASQVVRTVTVVDEISASLASQFGMMGMM